MATYPPGDLQSAGTNDDEPTDELPDDLDPEDVTAAATGAGMLIYVIEREYREHLGREVEVGRGLIGFADVDDWETIEQAARARGHSSGDVLHLPEFDAECIPVEEEA